MASLVNPVHKQIFFDHICEREQIHKSIPIPAKMICQTWESCLCILQAKDILQMLVNEVEGTNQLVESCRIYFSSELFITELECLAYFNYYVTFPFLNCIEVTSKIQLLEILPKLYSDLRWKNRPFAKLYCFNSWNVISCFDQQSIYKNFKDDVHVCSVCS